MRQGSPEGVPRKTGMRGFVAAIFIFAYFSADRSVVYMKKIFSVLIMAVVLLTGCTATIPLALNINDFVSMATKANRKDTVSLEVISHIRDGETTVFRHDGVSRTGTVRVAAGWTLARMVNEYIHTKFVNVSESGNTRIVVTLQSFVARDYNIERAGYTVLRLAFGDSSMESRMVSIRVIAAVDVIQGGRTETKNLVATSESNYFGSFTSTEGNRAFSNCVNNVNNRILMQLNAFLEELGM
jgi:hypothetical protein